MNANVWDEIFQTPHLERGYDEDRPWLSHPRVHSPNDDRRVATMKFTASLLLAVAEVSGMAAVKAWNLEDGEDRARLWQHVREADQLLATLKVGLQEYDDRSNE